MSLSTLDKKVPSCQPYPVHLLDALKSLNYSLKPAKRQRPLYQKKAPLKRERRGPKLDPKAKLRSKNVTMEGYSSTTNVKALTMRTKQRKLKTLEFIPTLKKLDMETEKEREIQRVMNNLSLSNNKASVNHRALTPSFTSTQSPRVSYSGADFTSNLLEGHNLTLKQLREFWSEMPSFLSIQAASLKRKYGMFENYGNDIDDISIEIVTKWNQPNSTLLSRIELKRPGNLSAIQEET